MTPAHWKPAQPARAARTAVRAAVHAIALQAGSTMTTRPTYPGAQTTSRDVEPLAGASAARAIELAAQQAARGYIRDAREAGHTWHQVGQALSLNLGSDRLQIGDTVAEVAYDYAAGPPDTETARPYGRSFAWTCTSCDKTISDRGPGNSPADDEHGHAEHCRRLAAAVAAWQAECEAPVTEFVRSLWK